VHRLLLALSLSGLALSGCGGGRNDAATGANRSNSVVIEDAGTSTSGKATVRMDGEVTPGTAEKLRIAHLPPRKKFFVSLGPAGNTNGCRDQGFSCGVAIRPEPGSPPFEASRKGHAVARFVMPTEYHKAQEPQGTLMADYPFQNGQRIILAVSALGQVGSHDLFSALGRARATVVASPSAAG
jgi:hypothetical protein